MTERARGLLARRWEVVPRAGLGLAAVGGVLAALSGGLRGAEQLGGLATVDINSGRIAAVGLVGAALLVALALAPVPLWRIIGVAIATLLGILLLLVVTGVRTDGALVADVDVSLAPGGWLLVLAAVMAFAGLGLALVSGFMAPDRLPEWLQSWPHLEKLAFALAAAGIILPPLAASGAALGQRLLQGPERRRPLALAAVTGGIAIVTVWTVGAFFGALFARP